MAASLGQDALVPRGRPGRVVHASGRPAEDQSGPGRPAGQARGAHWMSSTGRVSPTAHYTGYVWARNGLSDPELETVEGRVLFETLRPAMTGLRLLGQASLEPYLLARHRALDALLERVMAEREISQVIEIAAGLSP